MKIVVIGGGIGGYTAAIKAAQYKAEVVLIEKGKLGGTCLNRGCIPTKAFLHDAHIIDAVRTSKAQGIFDSVPNHNVQAIIDRKDTIVTRLRDGIASLCKANKIEMIEDEASFIDQNTLFLKNKKENISADFFIVATGSMPSRLPIDGAQSEEIWTSDDCFDTPLLPGMHVCLIGGGVIGVELATFYKSIGCNVTIVEAQKRILPSIDRDAANQLATILKKQSVTILTNAFVKEIKSVSPYQVICTVNDIEHKIVADRIIQSVGRKAVFSDLKLENARIESNKVIQVNDAYQTNVSHIYAIGDVNGQSWLAHAAAAQGKVAVDHIFNPEKPTHQLLIPSVVYSDPQIASIGLDEAIAKEQNIEINVGKFLVSANGKHVVEGKERGFIKVITDKENKILGSTIFSHLASEMIPYMTQAILTHQTIESLEGVVFPHPTLTESLEDAMADVLGMSIHSFPKVRNNI
ncbi:MAG: dihydrolipoyl dehydrogenase [Erysipelotrichaceae bacterium]|nr:dihydrolipoyl dehydrogenase [Erysipelotrichaceae bacterium]